MAASVLLVMPPALGSPAVLRVVLSVLRSPPVRLVMPSGLRSPLLARVVQSVLRLAMVMLLANSRSRGLSP